MQVDPITLEVISNRLEEIQRIMKHRLFHTGYSTILRESFDGGAGMTDSQGRVIGASGMTTHTIPYGQFVRGILAGHGAEDIEDGDIFISNDPYRGGVTHTPDMAVGAPVFFNGQLIAFCTSFGHKPDIGGLSPGTGSPASRSIFHEGLLVPPVKIHAAGKPIDSVLRILANNSRTPELLMGDIQGQIGCTLIGSDLLRALCSQYGVDVVLASVEQLFASSAKRLRHALAAMPDGESEAERFLDGDGVRDAKVRVHVKVTKRGERLTVDLSGSDPQTDGPANAVVQVIEAATIGAVLSVVDHHIANNEGVRQAIDFVCPPGLVVNPRFPAPVNSYIPTTHLVYSCVSEAVGKLSPEHAVADSGFGLGAIAFGYKATGTGESYVHYEITQTALGGTASADGCSIIFPMMIFETIQPIEIVESEFPVRIVDFSVWMDSAGAGEHRGGVGYCREFELLEETQVISRLAQRKYGALGAAGGRPSALSRTIVRTPDGNEQALPGLAQMTLPAGTRVRIEQSGGGGWGDPHGRARDRIVADIEDRYVSPEAARADYGIAVGIDDLGRASIGQR